MKVRILITLEEGLKEKAKEKIKKQGGKFSPYVEELIRKDLNLVGKK